VFLSATQILKGLSDHAYIILAFASGYTAATCPALLTSFSPNTALQSLFTVASGISMRDAQNHGSLQVTAIIGIKNWLTTSSGTKGKTLP
jgi:hypothetical protein